MKTKQLILIFFSLPILSLFVMADELDDYSAANLEKEIKSVRAFKSLSDFYLFPVDSLDLPGKLFSIKEAQIEGYLYLERSGTKTFTDRTEYFDYFILYNKKLGVKKVKILNYNAPYGYQVTSKHWLKQFQTDRPGTVFKINKNIDAISGATLSAKTLTERINHINQTISKIE